MSKYLMNHRFLGIVFVLFLLVALWLVSSIFNQKFTPFDKVALKTPTAGLQLPQRADVKVRGMIVGEVLDQHTKGDTATLTLGIKPNMIKEIPRNATASLLPKTLFGEKYVSLDIPQDPSHTPLKAGDTIGRTDVPVEVEKVLNDLYPLLRTVQPAELSYTLNALADALDGRGDKLGNGVVTLNNYLTRLNPQVPQLVADIRLLDNVSGTYADVFPQIADLLRNSVKTGGTLRGREATLHAFLTDATAFSNEAKSFLDANGENIIKLGRVSEPILALLARYSSEFTCLPEGLDRQAPRLAETFRGFIFHINLKLVSKQPRGYSRGTDHPVFGANNPATCGGLPNPPVPYPALPNFNDGTSGLGRGDGQRVAPGFAHRSAAGPAGSVSRSVSASAAGTESASSGGAGNPLGVSAMAGGTSDQKRLIGALTAPVMGVPVDQVPDITTLLFAPAAAGTEVSVQ